ncbi:probable serine hydrolase [Vespa velutina]|uniref:probable serine hydrolase n=1 Tax=Vespa velutina TaxID=202808 RepID=UPI001FB4FB94|nr:probable serine hydrolase [Vespa velutina]XP_047344104.1 probable serine hydrolase [Vespa velutina]XP_047344105.1 probable serine hydrolase [Vespa velutina]
MDRRFFSNWKTIVVKYKSFKYNANNLYPVSQRSIYSKVEPIDKDISNVEIIVPWGKIAGKLWGNDKTKQPILALHGWQDNAATFDNLIPLIKKHEPILAIDLPGHGLSSWLPQGQIYLEINYILLISRLKKYFGWKKVKLLAHSLSSHICFCYASLYSDETDYVISFDHLKPFSTNIQNYKRTLSKNIEQFLMIEEMKNKPPVYKKEELIKKWTQNTFRSLNVNACEILMTRGVTEMSDGTVYINRDPRLRISPFYTCWSHEQLKEMATYIKCPYLIIQSDKEMYMEDLKYYYDIVDILKKSSNDCQYYFIPGTHHIHLTNAEALVTVINSFLEKHNK